MQITFSTRAGGGHGNYIRRKLYKLLENLIKFRKYDL